MGRRFKIKNGVSLEDDGQSDKEEVAEAAEEVEDMSEIAIARRERSKSDVELDLLNNDNYYQLLGLGHVFRDVTESEVIAGYKKAAILYHPDKRSRGRKPEDVRKLWLKVQRGYETLLDPKMKQRYDSSLPADDEIPTKEECVDDETFYRLFDACFRRNGLFSNKLPYLDPVDNVKKCPLLGNADTPMEEVNAFYKFWTNFDSWRVFDHFAKNSIESIKQAHDRHQKRKMEKENATEVKAHAAKEHKRMIELVERARKLDPRIRAAEAAALEAKQATKNAAANKKNEEKAKLMAAKNAL